MKHIDTNIDFDKWKQKKNVGIAVCSGGLDSTSMGLAMLRDGMSVIFCHVNLAQKSEIGEKEAVKNIVDYLDTDGYDVGYFIVDTPWLGELGGSSLTSKDINIPKGMDSLLESKNIADNLNNPGLWTPARNVVLLSVASALADRIHAKKVTLGANQSELAYRDNTMDFLKAFELTDRFGTLIMPEITAPLYEMDKAEILKWYMENDFYDILKYTWSCDAGKEKPCGVCGCCCNRRLAFYILNTILQGSSKRVYMDNQKYMNDDYFAVTFLRDCIKRAVPGIWYEEYLSDLKQLVGGI